MFFSFLSFNSWLFVVVTDVFKGFAIDFFVGPFSLLPTFTLSKDLKQHVSFSDIFSSVKKKKKNGRPIFPFLINNVVYFAFRIFNIMHITTFLNHGIKTLLFRKKNIL